MKPTCPFCVKVMQFVDQHDLGEKIEYRDIVADDAHAEALIARGGKRQVPYLVDEEQNIEMYESDDIIAHLQTHYVS